MSLSRGPHLARGCGVLDSAKSAPTSRSTLGLDSPRADVTHYSTRRCSRLCVSRRYHVYTPAHWRAARHSRTGIHTYARTTTSSPVQSRKPETPTGVMREPGRIVLIRSYYATSPSIHRLPFAPFFSPFSSSFLRLSRVCSVPFCSSRFFFYCHGQIRRCTALYTFMRFVMTSVITSFRETSCAPKVCVDINSKLLLDRCKKNSHFLISSKVEVTLNNNFLLIKINYNYYSLYI